MKRNVLLNKRFGGFSLSEDVVEKAIEKGMNEDHFLDGQYGTFYCDPLDMSQFEFRSDPRLVEAAREVKEAGGFITGSPLPSIRRPQPEDTVEIRSVRIEAHIHDHDGKEALKGRVYEEIE